jgi:hypothetical protein
MKSDWERKDKTLLGELYNNYIRFVFSKIASKSLA